MLELSQVAKKEVDSSLNATAHFGLARSRGHQMAAVLAFIQRDAMDVDFLSFQMAWTGKPNGKGSHSSREARSRALDTEVGLPFCLFHRH
jgi:hypothetical protein